MYKKPLKTMTLTITVLFFLVGISPQLAANQDRGNGHFNRQVAGSYLIDLNLTGTDGLPFSVQALATIAADGGVIATDTDDFGLGTDLFYHSPKQGAWKRAGKKDIEITVLEFAYDSFGNLTTIFRLNFLAGFAERHFDAGEGAVSFEAFVPGQDVLDPQTIPVATGGGSFTFRRIEP